MGTKIEIAGDLIPNLLGREGLISPFDVSDQRIAGGQFHLQLDPTLGALQEAANGIVPGPGAGISQSHRQGIPLFEVRRSNGGCVRRLTKIPPFPGEGIRAQVIAALILVLMALHDIPGTPGVAAGPGIVIAKGSAETFEIHLEGQTNAVTGR